jgi:hypothetical protein
MNRIKRWVGLGVVAAACVAGAAGPADAAPVTILVDFGDSSTQTTKAASPDDPNNSWNNVTQTIGAATGVALANMVATDGTGTGVGLTIVNRFNSVNTNGTQSSTVYPVDATRDTLYGNTETFGGLSNVFPSFKLTGLDPAETYDITFYASRTGASDNRTARYTLAGAATSSVDLNAANNVDTTVIAEDVVPNGTGEITISMAPAPSNNNANHFTYIGVMTVTGVVPEPAGALLVAAGMGLLSVRRRRNG